LLTHLRRLDLRRLENYLSAPFSEARHPVPGYPGKCVSFCRGRQGITSLDHPHGKPPKLHSGEAV
jgi:hypothetical protein